MFFMPFGPGGCAWWAFVCCVWFLGLVLFWFAWLLAVVVGGWVGPGLVFWAVLTVALAGSVLVVWGWLGFCWFCLESLILAQDERWRRA